MSDAALLRAAQAGDRAAAGAMVERYAGFAIIVARDYYIPGADREDVRQEALIGLYAAVLQFNGTGRFKSFVDMVVRRRLIECVRAAHRGRRRILTDAQRVVLLENEEMPAYEEAPSALGTDPLTIVILREQLAELDLAIACLSELERRAFLGVANGLSYCQIEGVSEGEKPKWVDNAMQRARIKLTAQGLRDAA